MEKRFIEIRSRYLSEALSFLGFKYQKFGYGSETKYSFQDTQLIQDTVTKLIKMKKDLNLVLY